MNVWVIQFWQSLIHCTTAVLNGLSGNLTELIVTDFWLASGSASFFFMFFCIVYVYNKRTHTKTISWKLSGKKFEVNQRFRTGGMYLQNFICSKFAPLPNLFWKNNWKQFYQLKTTWLMKFSDAVRSGFRISNFYWKKSFGNPKSDIPFC